MERYLNRSKENSNSDFEDDPDPKDPDWNEVNELSEEIIEQDIEIDMSFSDEETGDIIDNTAHKKSKLSKLKAKSVKRIKQKNTG